MNARYVLCHLAVFSLLVTFLFSIMYYLVSDTTYPSKFCNPDLCKPNQRHVGCHPPGFSLICIKPRVTSINTKMKRTILDYHNKLRNQMTIGCVSNLSKAINIGPVTWNNDLAYLAATNSKECAIHYDECINTKEYGHVGQNIVEMHVNHNIINSDIIFAMIPKLIDTWFAEHTKATQKLMDKFDITEGAKIQRFANIINADTVKIGCGMNIYFSLAKKLMALFVCNYSSSPYHGQPVYKSKK